MCREYLRIKHWPKRIKLKKNLTFSGPTGLEDGSILQSPTHGEEKTNINLKNQRIKKE